MKDGRGLRTAFPDVIPLERADVLEDLKSFVDVHRLTDFTLDDRVVPTIELRRLEDELIIVFSQFVAALAANFSFVQLFNGTTVANLRPIAAHVANFTGTTVGLSFDTVAVGVAVVGTVADRRRSGLVIPASAIGRFSANQLPAVPGSGSVFQLTPGIGRGVDVPQRLLDTMVLPPGTGINLQASNANEAVGISIAYKVQQINITRPAGV